MGTGSNDVIREKYFNKHPRSLAKIQIKRIFEQMNKSICKIVDYNGTGFICRIPYPNNLNLLPVLITCNHVLKNEHIKPGKEIKLVFEEEEKIIKIDDERKIYKSIEKEYDTTIIEIKKTDGFDFKNFLEVDENIFKDNLDSLLKSKTIYVIHYPNVDEIKYSVDVINIIDGDKIRHFCETDPGSSGSPILNLDTFKVIGIHSGHVKEKLKFNIGTIIKYPIEGLIKEFPPKVEKNEILLKLIIREEDLKKKIYFLDNSSSLNEISEEEFDNYLEELIENNKGNVDNVLKEIIEKGKRKIHNNLEELNENNTKIYINNIEHKYFNHFIHKKIGVYQIKIEINIPITNCSYMFYCCNNIIDFDFSSFKTRSITNMSYMFSRCKGIQRIDLSSFDTKNVTNMSNMFSYCVNLREVDLSSFSTSNVTNMSKMFTFCLNLININVGNFDVSKVIEMNGMFNTCKRLISIDLSTFIAKSATNVSGMFRGCEALKSIKFFDFDGENITNMRGMFFKCSSLIYLDLESFNTSNVTDMSKMFYGCQQLEYINISNFNTKNVLSMSYMFFLCTNLKVLNLMSFDTKNVKNMDEMFSMCTNLENLLIGFFDLSNIQSLNMMFKNCMNLKQLVASKETQLKIKNELDNRYVEPKLIDGIYYI